MTKTMWNKILLTAPIWMPFAFYFYIRLFCWVLGITFIANTAIAIGIFLCGLLIGALFIVIGDSK